MAVATATDNGSNMYDQVKKMAMATQQAANSAEQASLISLSTTIEAAQSIASNVESKATTLNTDLATLQTALDGQLTTEQGNVTTAVQNVTAALNTENTDAGLYETSLRELNAVNASQVYINEVTNYDLRWSDPGLPNPDDDDLPLTVTLPNMGRTMKVQFNAYPSQCKLQAYRIMFLLEQDVKNFNWESAATLPEGYFKEISHKEMIKKAPTPEEVKKAKAAGKEPPATEYYESYTRTYLTQEGVANINNNFEEQASPTAVIDALAKKTDSDPASLTTDMNTEVTNKVNADFDTYYDAKPKPRDWDSYSDEQKAAYKQTQREEWDVVHLEPRTITYQSEWMHAAVRTDFKEEMTTEVQSYRPNDYDSWKVEKQEAWTKRQEQAWVATFIKTTEQTWVNHQNHALDKKLHDEEVDTDPLVDINGNAVQRGNVYQVMIYAVSDDQICNPDVDAGMLSQPSLQALLAQQLYTTTPANTILESEVTPIGDPCNTDTDPYNEDSYIFLPSTYTSTEAERQFYLYMYRDTSGIITTNAIFNIDKQAIERESLSSVMGMPGQQISEYRVLLMRDGDCHAYLANLNAEKQNQKLYHLSYQMGVAQQQYQNASDALMRYQVQNPGAGPDDSTLVKLTMRKQLPSKNTMPLASSTTWPLKPPKRPTKTEPTILPLTRAYWPIYRLAIMWWPNR